jgi:hypothetical protein
VTEYIEIATTPKWRTRLAKERQYLPSFEGLTATEWRKLVHSQSLLSTNHDTVVALDWPHYCTNATTACGGSNGYCYTFQGHQASSNHDRHVARVDALAREHPALFGELVYDEVTKLVAKGLLPYPNLRYSGSGEFTRAHLEGIFSVHERGVQLWGFTRNVDMAVQLKEGGIGVLLSCDRTTSPEIIDLARAQGVGLAYVSANVTDVPPLGTVVTFPIHRGGRVREVVDSDTLCPKVLDDFFLDQRPKGSCQFRCTRCHFPDGQQGGDPQCK